DLLAMVAASLGQETTARQALLLYEATIRSGMTDAGVSEELLTRSHEAAPTLPFASRLGADLSRARGDVPKLLECLRKQQAAATEYERAGASDEARNAARAAAESGGSELARTAETPALEGVADELAGSRATEHRALGADGHEDLEAVATRLVDLPDRREAMAH